MVQEIWEFTVLCKLGHDTWPRRMMPRRISIYCTEDTTPLLEAFHSRTSHGSLDQLDIMTLVTPLALVNARNWLIPYGSVPFPYLVRSEQFYQVNGFRYKEVPVRGWLN